MKNLSFTPDRRKFLAQSFTLALSFSAIPSIAKVPLSGRFANNEKIPPLEADVVFQFVGAAHVNFAKTKELLTKEPMLANACWDWGGGDFETALGGASHMGSRDIANYLLDNNARIDIFCAAMLGDKGVVESLIKSKPAIANIPGPHKFPLLYHVAICGNTIIADIVKPHIDKGRIAKDCNRSLLAAARDGQTLMTEWLFANGANDANTTDVLGRTPLRLAEEKGYKDVIMLLKKHGAK